MRAALKRLRYSQPFNKTATASVRSVCRLLGNTPDVFPRHLHRTGDVHERLPNGSTLRLHSEGDDWVTNLVFWKGWKAYEPGTIDLFYRLAVRSATVLDIGSYVGFFSLIAAHANPAARIYAFEPMEAIHRRLRANIALNALSNVETFNVAVSDSGGHATFFFSQSALREGLPTSSSLSETFMATASEVTGVDVPLITIDDFVRERSLGRVDLVKIDTETTEPSVLQGMKTVLQRDKPTIVCEILQDRVDTAAIEGLLSPLGYSFFLLKPDGPERRASIEGHSEFLNYLCTARPDRDLS